MMVNTVSLQMRSPVKRAIANALFAATMQIGCLIAATHGATAQTQKNGDNIRVLSDQLHQLTITEVLSHPFRVQKAAIGQIAFNEDASTVVLTPFSGRVTRLIAKVGDMVKPGDPLFEVDSPEVVQAQTDLIAAVHSLDKTKSSQALAKRVMDRQTNLLSDRATSQREADQARNDYAAAESDLRTAEGALTAARNRLRVIIGRDQGEVARVERDRIINPLIAVGAPIQGTVVARKVGPGQYVRSDAGDQLYSIVDLSTMWLKANVPENDIPLVRVGQQVEVTVSALPDRVFKAQVTAIGASSDASTRRVVVRSEIPNPDGALRAEMFATFRISTNANVPSPSVPADAVIWEGEQAIVWIEKEPMTFQRRLVKIGMEQGGRLQIRDGLKAGDRVVTRGAIYVNNEWRQ